MGESHWVIDEGPASAMQVDSSGVIIKMRSPHGQTWGHSGLLNMQEGEKKEEPSSRSLDWDGRIQKDGGRLGGRGWGEVGVGERVMKF